MELWSEIRRRVLTGEISKRAACLQYELHWETLVKILTHEELASVRELFGLFLACGNAELEANLMLGDFEHWYFRHEQFRAQVTEICRFDQVEVFRSRVSATGILTSAEHEELAAEIRMTGDFCDESLARVETGVQEVRWLQRQGLTPDEYLGILGRAPDVGFVMVANGGQSREPSDRFAMQAGL